MAEAQTTFTVQNNFNNSNAQYTDYFGNYYQDNQVWLYFENTGGGVTYTATGGGGTQTITDSVAVQLSQIQGGTFNLATNQNSTKIYAGLGTTNPFSGSNGPGIFDTYVPYAVAEWTVLGNVNDNLDVSYLDSISYPTKMTVTGTNPSTTKFPAGTTANSIVNALKAKMPNAGPVGPATNMPTQGQVGYGPEIATVDGQANAVRWIGSSKYWFSAANASNQTSVYTYAPSYNDYLGFLKANAPTNTETGITGWYLDYSGNGGYSGYLTVTGSDGAYGLEIHDVRINTNPSAANDWEADPTAGTSLDGTITITANGATVVGEVGGVETNVTGNFTDILIYSGADILDPTGNFTDGPVVTTTGSLANSQYIATLIATVSSSMGTGLLGSDFYLDALNDPTTPQGLMYWFAEITREQMLENLFSEATFNNISGLEYYDPYWGVLAELSGLEGYLSPFSDRYSQVSPDVSFGVGYSAVWELGVPVPEPGTVSLLMVSLLGGSFFMRRGRRVANA